MKVQGISLYRGDGVARLLIVLSLLAVGAWYVYDTCCRMEQIASNTYNSDQVMEMLENLEAPAAGGKK